MPASSDAAVFATVSWFRISYIQSAHRVCPKGFDGPHIKLNEALLSSKGIVKELHLVLTVLHSALERSASN